MAERHRQLRAASLWPCALSCAPWRFLRDGPVRACCTPRAGRSATRAASGAESSCSQHVITTTRAPSGRPNDASRRLHARARTRRWRPLSEREASAHGFCRLSERTRPLETQGGPQQPQSGVQRPSAEGVAKNKRRPRLVPMNCGLERVRRQQTESKATCYRSGFELAATQACPSYLRSGERYPVSVLEPPPPAPCGFVSRMTHFTTAQQTGLKQRQITSIIFLRQFPNHLSVIMTQNQRLSFKYAVAICYFFEIINAHSSGKVA